MLNTSVYQDTNVAAGAGEATANVLQRPVFIAGAGRSGTTLMRSLLSAHSAICVSPETHYMARALKWGLRKHEGPVDFDKFWSRYTSSVRFRDLGVDPDHCRALIERAGRPTFRSIFDAVLTAYGQRAEKTRVGEKTPGHVHYIPDLLSWFPDARVLILRRDPRAVVASQLRSPWVKERLTPSSLRRGILVGSHLHQVANYAHDWSNIYEQTVPTWQADPRVKVVEYEALVRDPEQEMRAVCAFLEEPFEHSMLDSRTDENVPIPASTSDLGDAEWKKWREKHHAATLRPVFSSSLDKWREQLTDREVAMIEGCCTTGMNGNGYTPVSPAPHRAGGRRMARVLLVLENAEASIRIHPVNMLRVTRKRARGMARRRLKYMARTGVQRGLPASWFGYRWVERQTVSEYLARGNALNGDGRCDILDDSVVADNPLPCNIGSRERLSDVTGWWGFSFRDVPKRRGEATRILTLSDCRVIWYEDRDQDDDFHPAILTREERALDLREVRFRSRHGERLRKSGSVAHIERATWILERVYHNHSHWLTAHLPKILLLQERGGLDDVLLPPALTPVMDGSLRMLGLDPGAFPTFDTEHPLEVGELTIVQHDRFRPDLLQRVQTAFASPAARPHRKVYISRAKAPRRSLANEDEVWPLFEDAGFEWVVMEDLSFAEQVELMRETAVLAGPHGAGLTNMIFCPPGTHVLEMADAGFPNPNFYALACGLNQHYWMLGGEAAGYGSPLVRDFRIDAAQVKSVLRRMGNMSVESVTAHPPRSA